MPKKEEIRQVYIDTCLIYGWILKLMRGEKNFEEPRIIKFLRDHPEIKKFISIFTIAELCDKLLFRETKIRDYMRKLEIVKEFSNLLMRLTGIRIIEFEKKGDHQGIFVSPKIVTYTATCGGIQDAIHVCIAEHEDLWFVTHDDRIGKLKPLYKKITTDTHLLKLFG